MLVVGAGAAGLLAAIVAAERGRRVVLLEKNRRPGLKILISGGGRCNLTTTRTGADLEAQYGARRGRWLRHALRSFPPPALCAMLESAGVPLREEDLEKIFPVSGRAGDVLEALLARVRAAGVRLVPEAPMRSIERDPRDGGFVVHTPQGAFRAPSVVLATGGLSYPRTGATGDGYAVARAFGHTLVPPVPALAPLAVDVPWVHTLAGIVLPAAELTLRDASGAVLCVRRRPTLFTHKGLSGPGPMDLSGFVEERGGACTLAIDLVPGLSSADLDAALLAEAQRDGRRSVVHCLPAELPERLRATLVELAAADTTVAQLGRAARRRLVDLMKALTIPVHRSLGFSHAEVTRGGVALAEVDPRTMESRLVPRLYFAGEILDIDGPIGGFNFQAAFATGRLAGLHA